MDIVLNVFDDAFFDKLYFGLLERGDGLRQLLSLYFIVTIGGAILYLILATLSYHLIFDKSLMKHKRFIKSQRFLEIVTSLINIPKMAIPTALIFWLQVRGYGKLYDNISEYGYLYWILSIFLFILWSDMAIYWIHRWLHHPIFYSRFHKPHHKWLVPTPFASHAFHWLDGFSQSSPYHMFIFMLPLHKWTYLVLFVFVNIWSVSIHDGLDLVPNCFQNILNGSAHHTDHHLHFNYNYGQFFTLWDFVGKSHRDPHVGELSIMEKDLIRTEIPEEESELLQHLNKND